MLIANSSLASLATRDNSCPSLVPNPRPAVRRLQYACQLCMESLGKATSVRVPLYRFHSRLCIQDW